MTRSLDWDTILGASSYKSDSPPDAPKISESGGMLHKSRLGKAPPSLTCQECEGEGAVQLNCLHVLCRSCVKEHLHV